MNLVKIGGRYYNLEMVSCIEPGVRNTAPSSDPPNQTPVYYLYFSGITQFVMVINPEEYEAVSRFLAANARPLVHPEPAK